MSQYQRTINEHHARQIANHICRDDPAVPMSIDDDVVEEIAQVLLKAYGKLSVGEKGWLAQQGYRALEERQAASQPQSGPQLTWTRNRPDVEGWWVVINGGGRIDVCWVSQDHKDEPSSIWPKNGGGLFMTDPKLKDWWWYGPIPDPETNTTDG